MKVTVTNIKKSFRNTEALKGISFEFGAHQIFGFVGPNGAGKTTTLRILASLDLPSQGDGFINGLSITQFPDKIRQWVGYMPDRLPTQDDISVLEYIDFFARAYGLRGNTRKQNLAEVMEFTALGKIRNKTLNTLSKGMKQRVSLARALVHDPQVLLLDEPAAGLDPRARVELNELLKLLAAQGKAILISSHILAELTEICHGAIIIEQGRILRSGTMDHLLQPNSPHSHFIIRAYDNNEALLKAVLERPRVARAHLAGNDIIMEVNGDEKTGCELLADLIRQGHLISEFKRQSTDLGAVFMQITKGEVQ